MEQHLQSSIEVSERLGIPERTLGQWRYRGVGPDFIHVGRHVRYRPEDVDRWLDRQTISHGIAS